VATQTTLYQFAQNVIEDEAVFFANYSVPLQVARQVNFWVRDGIAEDYLFFAKCFIHFRSKFRVLPFYGVFEGDAVESDDYVESLANQYKQLQRWTWGGVESWPYLFYHLFMDARGRTMPLARRLKLMFALFTNHFFWATTPLFFSIGVFLPIYFGGEAFNSTPAAQSLSDFSTYFALMSVVFLSAFTYITFKYIAPKASQGEKLNVKYVAMIVLQWLASPFLYGFMGVPALDSQSRGILGKYLGYWVTPKK
jgi:cellulose synthase/poly-beta-1,6-N-acetylglucosamine synthase-like glycosyltransferase